MVILWSFYGHVMVILQQAIYGVKSAIHWACPTSVEAWRRSMTFCLAESRETAAMAENGESCKYV